MNIFDSERTHRGKWIGRGLRTRERHLKDDFIENESDPEEYYEEGSGFRC